MYVPLINLVLVAVALMILQSLEKPPRIQSFCWTCGRPFAGTSKSAGSAGLDPEFVVYGPKCFWKKSVIVL